MSQAGQSDIITVRLSELPKGPGVYFHKNSHGDIIYIGKAARLNARVRQYFQKSRYRDPKTDALVAEITDIEWTETETEIDALFLEAELIRRYQPKYNILLRDDKSLTYVRISYNDTHPTVVLTRRPLDDGARYFGPYFSAQTLKRALRYLRKAFPYSTHTGAMPKRACLQAQLGLCPGLESGHTNLSEYRENLKLLMQYLRGQRKTIIRELETEMKLAASEQNFERAAQLRNKKQVLERLGQHIVFSDKESLDMSKDRGLVGLASILQLPDIPARIEGYDISHMQGTDTVASMVVFDRGIPDKSAYRKFKMRLPGNDDYLHMKEVIRRRFAPSKQKSWGAPSLCIIDGGKGQLAAALDGRDERSHSEPIIALAKRLEQIVIDRHRSNVTVDEAAVRGMGGFIDSGKVFIVIELPQRSDVITLLQRIRDESHRFAVSYHSVLKRQRTTSSQLDAIAGIGPATKKKLLKEFGSFRAVTHASEAELAAVVGPAKAALISRHINLTASS